MWVGIQWTGRLSMVRTLFVCVLGDSENLISVSGDLSWRASFSGDGFYKLFYFHIIYRPVLTRERKVTSTVWEGIQWMWRLCMVLTLILCVSHPLPLLYASWLSIEASWHSWDHAFCAVSGFRVSRLATPNIILNSVLEIIWVWIDVTWSPWWRVVLGEKSWSALGRGLGSDTVQTAGAVKHLFVRLAWLVSDNRRPEASGGFRFNNWLDRARPRYTIYDVWPVSQERLQYSGRPYPTCLSEDETVIAMPQYYSIICCVSKHSYYCCTVDPCSPSRLLSVQV